MQGDDWDALVQRIVTLLLEDGLWADDVRPSVERLVYYDGEAEVGTDATYADLEQFQRNCDSLYKLDRADIIQTLADERR